MTVRNPELKRAPVLAGGDVSINGYSVNLAEGSVIDVSGGARIDSLGSELMATLAAYTIRHLSLTRAGGRDWVPNYGFCGHGTAGCIPGDSAPLIQIGVAPATPRELLLRSRLSNRGRLQ